MWTRISGSARPATTISKRERHHEHHGHDAAVADPDQRRQLNAPISRAAVTSALGTA